MYVHSKVLYVVSFNSNIHNINILMNNLIVTLKMICLPFKLILLINSEKDYMIFKKINNIMFSFVIGHLTKFRYFVMPIRIN